jgi:hypothetical protein
MKILQVKILLFKENRCITVEWPEVKQDNFYKKMPEIRNAFNKKGWILIKWMRLRNYERNF